MAKRFTDTDKWKREWFCDLDHKAKLVWIYLLDQCDHRGVWYSNFKLLSMQVGFKVTPEDFWRWFNGKIKFFDGDKYFIESFIKFQYGTLNPQNNAHKAIIELLKTIENQAPAQPLISPSEGAQDKDKDKDNCISFEGGVGETFGPRQLAEVWNERVKNVKGFDGSQMPQVNLEKFDATDSRWKAARGRLAKEASREFWVDIIDRIARSEFCRGRNNQSWKANFEFLVRPDTTTKVLEGSYGCKARNPYTLSASAASNDIRVAEPPPTPEITPEVRQEQAAQLRSILSSVRGLK